MNSFWQPVAPKCEGRVRPHGVFGVARLEWAGQTDLRSDREATHCQGAGQGSRDLDVGHTAHAPEGRWGLPTREVGPPWGADSAVGVARVRKWCGCSARGQRFCEVTEGWWSAENLCRGRM